MITVIVSYRVKPGYVGQNKQNIRLFLEDFEKIQQGNFTYRIFTKDDGCTFVHLSSYKNEKVQADVLNVASFREFQRQRNESGLNASHKVEVLTPVDMEFRLSKQITLNH